MARLRSDVRRAADGIAAAACAAVLATLLAGFSAAVEPLGEVHYTRSTEMRIPFELDPQVSRRLREVELYVSLDQGKTWNRYALARPEDRGFVFRAARDGLYWFTVREIDSEGRANPPSIQGARPQLMIYVDTQPELIFLRPLTSPNYRLAVEWEVRDETLNLQSLRLEYRQGGSGWLPLRIDYRSTGQCHWNPGGSGPVEVRLRLQDRQGNPRETRLTLNPTGSEDVRGLGQLADASAAAAVRPNTPITCVNSKQVRVNFEISGEGKSGARVELWYTRDGNAWLRGPDAGPVPRPQPPIIFTAPDEGLYGLRLVTRSGVGVGDRPPQVGDPPDLWVEVDLTRPVVEMDEPVVGQGPDHGKMIITWRAEDKNLAQQPITLSYGTKPDGGERPTQWVPIQANLANTGRYVWIMRDDLPLSLFIRVEARDRAGNIGVAESRREVIVDLSRPKGRITGVLSADLQK